MASRSTRISIEVRSALIQGILDQEKRVGFRDLDHLLWWYLGYVGDGFIYRKDGMDETTTLACHSAVLTVQMVMVRAHEKDLSVAQTIQLLKTALPIQV